MKALFISILTAITGLFSYGLLLLVLSIWAYMLAGIDVGMILPLVAIATMLGWDAHDPGKAAFRRQGIALILATVALFLPRWVM